MNSEKLVASRDNVYGSPRTSWRRLIALKKVISECSDVYARHAMEMIAVKMSRLIESPWHQDSWDDIGGYAAIGKELTQREKIDGYPGTTSAKSLSSMVEVIGRASQPEPSRGNGKDRGDDYGIHSGNASRYGREG